MKSSSLIFGVPGGRVAELSAGCGLGVRQRAGLEAELWASWGRDLAALESVV